ncbi:hypothetical protein RRG08_055668 [Elysia crispata]|uniref:Uncharacterized protein n=1 Tax=Elysia crispata TaxID=231223 RepID=A0AAE1DCL9_9GAST|nr:hypothetical protein RRG08_055668 [Elysia crispata]
MEIIVGKNNGNGTGELSSRLVSSCRKCCGCKSLTKAIRRSDSQSQEHCGSTSEIQSDPTLLTPRSSQPFHLPGENNSMGQISSARRRVVTRAHRRE